MNINIENIVQEFSSYLRTSDTFWVAYSGGLDSTVLLYVMSHLAEHSNSTISAQASTIQLKAIHVNHQLSSNADLWQSHCEQFCMSLGVPLIAEKVHIQNTGKGIESAARNERYGVFERYMARSDVIVCGHHQDDVAETMMYRLMRGTGLQGLTGIRKHRELKNGVLVRPLLNFSRDEILSYAREHGLHWIEDESNHDQHYDRNFLRHALFPTLKQRWSNVQDRLATTAAWLAESNELMNEYGQQDLKFCELKKARQGESISLEVFTTLSNARQKHIIRYWCYRQNYMTPDAASLDKLSDVTHAREDASPVLVWGQCELRRYKKRLFLVKKLPDAMAVTPIVWDGVNTLKLEDGSKFSCSYTGEKALNLTIKWREQGERCQPENRRHSQTLKKLLQEYELEPWLRHRVPLIYINDELIAVGDLFICKNAEKYIDNTVGFEWFYD